MTEGLEVIVECDEALINEADEDAAEKGFTKTKSIENTPRWPRHYKIIYVKG